MTSTELYQKVLEKLSFPEMHPLHKAMLEECCENAINNEQGIADIDTLILAAQIAFLTCDSTLKSTIKGAVKAFDADVVNLEYRGQSFAINNESYFLK